MGFFESFNPAQCLVPFVFLPSERSLKVMEWLGVSSVSLSRLNIKPEDSRQCTNANAGGKAVIQAFLNRYIFIESGWSWGLGFGFPKIFGKRFSGSPSPYKHTYIYIIYACSLYMNMYSWVRVILLFWKQQSVIQMVLNKIIRKEAGHKSVYFNNCPLDLCLYYNYV